MLGRVSGRYRSLAQSLRAIVAFGETSSTQQLLQGCGQPPSTISDRYAALHAQQSGWLARDFNFRSMSSLEAAAAEHRLQSPYYVEVITGDVRGAGSPAPAAVQLFGEDGESESHVIGAEESGTGFERATRKTYVLYSRDLGPLKRVVVRQLPPSEGKAPSSSSNTGWYLDRIEVKGPEGDHWVFPCGAWLGRPGAASGIAPREAVEIGHEERNLIPAEMYRHVTRSSLHDPDHRITRPLEVDSSGIALPHPEKVKEGVKGVNRKGFGYGGEDSYFYASNSNGIFALGVADGVYEWRNTGIDAGEFSKQLVEYCRQAVELGTTDVLRVLQFASRHVRRAGTKGSSTACIVLVDTLQGRLSAANIGDSGFLLLGRNNYGASNFNNYAKVNGVTHHNGNQLHIRYRSPQQEHSFGHPYQLGHHEAADSAEDAMLSTMPIYPGDVLVVGTDGLFDNLSDEEIAEIVSNGVEQGQAPSAISHSLAFAAFGNSVDRSKATPYSLGASSAFDMVYNGGKSDDITALVVELH